MYDPDYRDMLFALSDAEAEFLIVGAYAMAAHGVPRNTGDLDIWVRPTPENARKVWKALLAFKAPMSEWSVEDFQNPNLFFQIGIRPCRIDLLCSIDGVDFEEAWRNRIYTEIEGKQIPVIGVESLLTNKRATDRPKDAVDVKLLERKFPRKP